ncbi:MAG: hypothetical protein QM754_09375 [Tepidisphaeraceae bacterium]
MKRIIASAVIGVLAAMSVAATPATQPTVASPPASFFETFRDQDQDAAKAFYAKYLDVGGLGIASAAVVDDAALYRTREIVGHMLAGRPDILAAMQQKKTRLIIIGRDQVYCDMPEYRNSRDPAYQNERVRGTGGFDVTSFGEENLLNLPIDRYDDESIAVHEFCHTIDSALRSIDPQWRTRLRDVYRNAVDKGRWNLAYAGSNQAEYWAEICQSYFDCNRINNWNHANVKTREQLKEYDPEGYELVRTTFNLAADKDWRYTPVQEQPSVIAPPAKFKVDPYYTKFTFARELPVIASSAVSDVAMLRANDTVRKLFAYRHDVLKAIINDGGKLVVLGRGERLTDLPELKSTAATQPAWDNARYLDYSPVTKIVVVPEENLLGDASDTMNAASSVVRAMARAAYIVTAGRPVDPDWDKRPARSWQQYELRQQRLDTRLRERLQTLFDQAQSRKLWRGTPAMTDLLTYWSNGVEAYFDAAGTGYAPVDADRPIVNRESLKAYDPDLFALIDETFSYRQHTDWRFKVATTRPVLEMGK